MEKINKDKYTNLVNGQYNISLLLTYYETKCNVIKSHNAILVEEKKGYTLQGKKSREQTKIKITNIIIFQQNQSMTNNWHWEILHNSF